MQELSDSFLITWRERYRWPREESRETSERRIMKIENLVKDNILSGRFVYTKQVLSDIVRWKAGPERERELEMLERFSANSESILTNTLTKVLSHLRNYRDDVTTVMNDLLKLKGVGIPVASAFLRFFDPAEHRYGVIDSHVARFLNDHGITNFDLREGDDWIKKYPESSCRTNVSEYQRYHNWLQVKARELQKKNATYMDVYGTQKSFAPVDIDMAIFAFMTQQTSMEMPQPQIEDLAMYPERPFTNITQLYQLMTSLKGQVQLLDKNFDSEAFKFMLKLDPARVNKLQILASKSHLGSHLKEEYKAFKIEMENRGIEVEFRILDDKDAQKIHDRYLLSSDVAYNTPPWNIIHKKLGDIKGVKDHWSKRNYIEKYWSRATDLLKIS